MPHLLIWMKMFTEFSQLLPATVQRTHTVDLWWMYVINFMKVFFVLNHRILFKKSFVGWIKIHRLFYRLLVEWFRFPSKSLRYGCIIECLKIEQNHYWGEWVYWSVNAFIHIKYVHENILYVIINIFIDWIMRQCIRMYFIDMPMVNWLWK